MTLGQAKTETALKRSEYREWSDKANDWIEGYFRELENHPVRAQTQPGEIANRLPDSPPEEAESMDRILEDFARIVPDGMTHWQHPKFFAYFSSNAAPASLIADQLVNALGAQCMLWQTSPAATEMEQVMCDWLRQALGFPEGYKGVLQDTASSTTLAAVLTMRERALNFTGNQQGLSGTNRLRIYCSGEVHSSVDKACWIAGIGQENLVKVATDAHFSMCPEALQRAIAEDRQMGYQPAGLVLCTGGTAIGASDHLPPLVDIAEREGLYTHLDAAWAGAAMICPEIRDVQWQAADRVDSVVINPHKWLGAQFDCSLQLLKDPTDQIKTLGIRPSYLHTAGKDGIVNFSEWTIALGRRFRALKLWFLIRAHGLEGLREMIRNHIQWTADLRDLFEADDQFEIYSDLRFSLFTFRYCPKGVDSNAATDALVQSINDDGRTYLTKTLHNGTPVIRFTAGPFECTRDDVLEVYDIVKAVAGQLRTSSAAGVE